MPERGDLTVREAGRRGGRATKLRHGPEFYETIGRNGGTATKTLYGPQFFQRIGRKGGHRLRQLVAQGKRAIG
jgi:general stress protein YciG